MAAPVVSAAEAAWQRQSVWSQTANRLKADLGRARTLALALTVTAAVLALAGSQLTAVNRPAGRVLAVVAAAAVALVPLARRAASAKQVGQWVQARSMAEALKAEVYLYLTRSSRYAGADRERQLDAECDRLERDADALRGHTAGVAPAARTLPDVHDLPSYLARRVTPQIDGYYRPHAAWLAGRLRTVRRVGIVLAGLAAVLAAAAGVWGWANVGAWVAVVTTVAAAVTAHAAAERYEFLLVEYTRTAEELTRLRDRRDRLTGPTGAPLTDEEFIRHCEQVISVQNDKWMAKWGSNTIEAS